MIKKYLRKNKKQSFVVIVFTFLQCMFGAGFAIIFQITVDYAEMLRNEEVPKTFFVYSVIFLFLYIVLFTLFNFLRRHFRASLIIAIDQQVKTDFFSEILKLNSEAYSKNNSAHYLSRFTNDLPVLINDYIVEFFNLLLYLFQVVLTTVVAFYINWLIAIIFLALSSIIIIYTTKFEKKFAAIKTSISKKSSEYLVSLKSSLQGFHEIKANGAEKIFEDNYGQTVKKLNKVRRKWWRLEAIYSPINAFLTLFLTFSAIVIASILYSLDYFSTGLLVATIYLSTVIFNPISDLFEQLTYLKSNKDLSNKIYEDFVQVNGEKINGVTFNYAISLDSVSFKYEEEKYVLKEVFLDIHKGKKYLVIGESGKGKSTLLKILAGRLEYEGDIMMDSTNYKEIEFSAKRQIISYVPQDSYLFNDSIRNNIDLAKKYNKDVIAAVIDKVSLNKFVQDKGLDTFIAEEVSEVSGGEKQRICLARALIREPQVLLLDEVTASLDRVTCEEIEKTILSLQNMTIVYICHKASDWLVRSFDYVIEFQEKNIKTWESNDYVNKVKEKA